MSKQRAGHTPGRWYLWRCDNGTWDVCEDTGDEFSGPVHQNVPESVLCAAPDLLAALEAIEHYVNEEPGFLLDGDEKLVRAALAKARGRA